MHVMRQTWGEPPDRLELKQTPVDLRYTDWPETVGHLARTGCAMLPFPRLVAQPVETREISIANEILVVKPTD